MYGPQSKTNQHTGNKTKIEGWEKGDRIEIEINVIQNWCYPPLF